MVIAWLFVTLAQNTLLVALSFPKYLQVVIPVPNIVIETPFNNLSVSEGRITRTGLMVYICNGMVTSQVSSVWQEKEQRWHGQTRWEGVFPQPVLHRLIYHNESHCSQCSPWGQVAAQWWHMPERDRPWYHGARHILATDSGPSLSCSLCRSIPEPLF